MKIKLVISRNNPSQKTSKWSNSVNFHFPQPNGGSKTVFKVCRIYGFNTEKMIFWPQLWNKRRLGAFHNFTPRQKLGFFWQKLFFQGFQFWILDKKLIIFAVHFVRRKWIFRKLGPFKVFKKWYQIINHFIQYGSFTYISILFNFMLYNHWFIWLDYKMMLLSVLRLFFTRKMG